MGKLYVDLSEEILTGWQVFWIVARLIGLVVFDVLACAYVIHLLRP